METKNSGRGGNRKSLPLAPRHDRAAALANALRHKAILIGAACCRLFAVSIKRIKVLRLCRMCTQQLVCGLLGDPPMTSADKRHRQPVSEPVPCTPSDEDIRKAQALREALRQRLLNRPEPNVSPYWTVGAE